jgi:prepilin-type N-terminal cleavage/methylation domain-containing protein
MSAGPSAIRRRLAALGSEGGFTLIELLVVVVLIGITSAMFGDTFSAVVNSSSQVQSQNILQTEVRASLNELVSDLRTASYGDTTSPIDNSFGATYITFYSPDRQTPPHMRKIRYWLDGTTLKRQEILSTNTDGPPWTRNGTDLTNITLPTVSDPVQILFGSIRNPLAAPVFKYCIQSPPDMTIDPSNATSPELITWSCTAATSAALVKTVIVRTVVSTLTSSVQYNYGAVATIRWNAS